MQCPRCHFENIPGQDRCFKCNSILEMQGGGLDIQPPRMASSERPWRVLGRWCRSLFTHRKERPIEEKQDRRGAAESLPIGGFVLSIVPGLGHLVAGRFKEVRLWWIIWLVLFITLVTLYGTPMGWFVLGLAAACHAYIALEVGILDYLDELGARVMAILVTTVLVMIVYGVFPRWPLNLRFIRVPFDVPAYNVRRGDLLVFRALDASTAELPSGTIVLSDVAQLRLLERRTLRVDRLVRRGVGQVVGCGLDQIIIDSEGTERPRQFYCEGEPLDPNEVPVPRWLHGVSWVGDVPSDHFFVSHTFRMSGQDFDITNHVIRSACMIPTERIHRRATMVWWPLQRRHFLP